MMGEAKRRRRDVVFGGDFIAGFPTEDKKAHNKSHFALNKKYTAQNEIVDLVNDLNDGWQ